MPEVVGSLTPALTPAIPDPGVAWAATTGKTAGDRIKVVDVASVEVVFESAGVGTTGGTVPDWFDPASEVLYTTVVDGTVFWFLVGAVGGAPMYPTQWILDGITSGALAARVVPEVLDLPTAETDTTKRAAPDGANGIQFVAQPAASIEIIIDGGGSAITTGIKGDIEVPFAATITAVRLLADQSGSIVIDIWKDTYANFPPTDADSITASAPPTITTATKSEDATLTGWTTAITAGNILRFNVDSATTVTRVTLSLILARP